MSHPLHNRSFLKELDFTAEEWSSLLELAAQLKADKKAGRAPAVVPHLAALAAEMKMALAEVYEVATFYAHFDVVKDRIEISALHFFNRNATVFREFNFETTR